MKFQYFSIPSDFSIHQAPHLLFPSLLLRNVQHHIRGRGDRDGQHLVMQSWRDLWGEISTQNVASKHGFL